VLLGQREDDVPLPVLAFFKGFAEFVGFLAGGGFFAGAGGGGFDVGEMVETGVEFVDEFAQVFIEDGVDGVPRVAVQVKERLEAAVGTGDEPVDGALLVILGVSEPFSVSAALAVGKPLCTGCGSRCLIAYFLAGALVRHFTP
jgi:hypothetical protein